MKSTRRSAWSKALLGNALSGSWTGSGDCGRQSGSGKLPLGRIVAHSEIWRCAYRCASEAPAPPGSRPLATDNVGYRASEIGRTKRAVLANCSMRTLTGTPAFSIPVGATTHLFSPQSFARNLSASEQPYATIPPISQSPIGTPDGLSWPAI